MGYTHYYTASRQETIPTNIWAKIVKDVNHLYHNLPEQVQIQLDYDADSPPVADKAVICFNGIEDFGHETFQFTPSVGGFDFCKTARKGYDLAVCVTLMLISCHLPKAFPLALSSDGFNETTLDGEWHDAIKYFKTTFPQYGKIKVGKHFPKVFVQNWNKRS